MSGQNERVLDQFTRQASAYAALVNKGDGRADPLVALLNVEPVHYLLDVGCGSGQFAVKVAPLVAEVLGVDLTPAMLEEARGHAKALGLGNVRWALADSVALPVGDGRFDRVVSRSMFHHADDPAATLAEMHRACAPRGQIFVSDLSPDPAKALAFDAVELLRDPSHKRALTLDDLRALGHERGLAEIAVRKGTTSLPLETVLATSFPPPGMLDHVRALLARDAAGGEDIFGMRAEVRDGAIWVSYPTMIVGWSVP
jgi:SAM-dependent methyltransferase